MLGPIKSTFPFLHLVDGHVGGTQLGGGFGGDFCFGGFGDAGRGGECQCRPDRGFGAVAGNGRELSSAALQPELHSITGQLAGAENRVAVERQRYNDAVRVYRTDTRRFPNNLFARTFGFGDRECFEADESVAEVPQIAL